MVVLIAATLRILGDLGQVRSLDAAGLADALASLLVLGPILQVALEVGSGVVLENHSIE